MKIELSVSLSLADDSCWTFRSGSGGIEWLNEFASTLSLIEAEKETQTEQWTIYVVSDSELDTCITGLGSSQSKCKEFDLGPLCVFALPDSQTHVYQIPDQSNRKDWLMSMWYGQYPLYPALLRAGNLPVHAGLGVYGKKGVLFAAPGGTGKSTTVRRLPSEWAAVNDDECWLVHTDSGLFAHPLPTWSDLVLRNINQTWPSSTAIPIHAIVFLRQAQTVSLTRLEHAATSNYLKQACEQILRRAWTSLPPPDLTQVRKRVFEQSERYSHYLQGFLLDLNLEDPFWETLQPVLEDGIQE
jgi:SynChlorMet cassette protein ScmC